MNHGKNDTQDFAEIVETLEKNKAEGLSLKRGQSLYTMQRDKFAVFSYASYFTLF